MSLLAILGSISVLALLVVVHELGHFLAARLQGIHVNRFSIGFGPILWKYQGPETEYAIRGFPLGGFVGFPDDDPDSNIPPEDPNLLRNRPILDRAIVISAGVIANLIFAYLVLVVQVGTVGIQEVNYQAGVRIPAISTEINSAAAKAGIQAGDLVVAVDGQKLPAAEDTIFNLKRLIESHPNQSLQLGIQRQNQIISLTVTPIAGSDGKGRIGVQLDPNRQLLWASSA